MKITEIQLFNVRGFKGIHKISTASSVNIFIGANNSGKSTILKSIHLLQERHVLKNSDITLGEANGNVLLNYKGYHEPEISQRWEDGSIEFQLKGDPITLRKATGSTHLHNIIQSNEPRNLIYPYLSKRKAVAYHDVMNESNVNAVTGNFTNLYSKIDRLVTPQFQPANSEYVKACNDILGFEVSTFAIGNGKQAVQYIYNSEHIPLTAMGEGVANILGLVTDLCVADNKIFLIEEPENDIHPKALKALLNLIASKAHINQFFISTHSNIVMKFLGGLNDAKIFNISNLERDTQRNNLMISSIQEISDSPVERKRVLEDLGYDFFDYDLWKAWLFLEESSAEVIIRDYLIKWFVPTLKHELRTFSAGSTSKIHPKFDDFNKLFVFLHLEPTYKNKVWVYIDAGEEERNIIEKMRATFELKGWKNEQFNQFNKHDFEEYYPEVFQEKVKEILELNDKQQKRNRKKELLDEVKNWILNDEKQAKEAFKTSAVEIINVLKKINTNLKSA